MKNISLAFGALLAISALNSAQAASFSIGSYSGLFQGIDETTATIDGGSGVSQAYIVRVDLSAPGVSFTTTPAAPGTTPNAGTANEVVTQTTSQFLKSSGAQVAINSNFFSCPCVTNASNSEYLLGLEMSNGTLVSSDQPGYTALLLSQSNQASFVAGGSVGSTSGIYNAVSGGGFVLQNGVDVVNGSLAGDPLNPNPRSVAGISQNGQYLYLMASRTQVVDLRGGTVTAGLVDSHTHPVLGLDAMAGLDLTSCTSVAEVRAALLAAPPGEWITGWGVDPNVFGDRAIHWREIDVVQRPVLLTLFDGHAALANPLALQAAGVTGSRAFASQARVVVDDDGRPTGHLLEEGAIVLVKSCVPAESFAVRKLRLGVLLAEMAATGLTGGHVMDLDGDALDLVEALEADHALPARLRFAPWVRPEDDAARTAHLLALQGRRGRTWEVAGVKLFIDGTIDAGTAWLHRPDCLGESTRPYWGDPADYTRAVQTFAAAGVQTSTHAIGDAAVEHVLATLEALDPRLRHRVEHIETLPLDQVGRFGPAGVVASMQPCHATDFTRADHTDNWSRRLGEERALRAWPCRDLVDAGAVLALGSDWPVAPYDPRLTLAAAQLRRPARRPDLAPIAAWQGLTAAQALYGMTRAPAFAACAEDRLGRVAPGYLADLTVWEADPLTVPATEIADLPVHLTVVDGHIVHRSWELL